MDLQEAERRTQSSSFFERIRPPAALILSAPLGIPVLSLFHRIIRNTTRPNDLKIHVNLRKRRKPPSFVLFQKIAAEIQKLYPDTWASVTENTPLEVPLRTSPSDLSRGEGYRWMQRIAQALAWFAVGPPLKIVVYHLENADSWSLETLRYLMSHLSTTPLQIFALWKSPPRPTETPLGSDLNHTHIHLLEIDSPSERALIRQWKHLVPEDILVPLIQETRRRPLALKAVLSALENFTSLTKQAFANWKRQLPQLLDHGDRAILLLLSVFEYGLTPRELRSLLNPAYVDLSRSLHYLQSLGLVFEDRGYWSASLPTLEVPRPSPEAFRLEAIHALSHPPHHKARFLQALGLHREAVPYLMQAGEQELAQGHLRQALQYLSAAEPHHPQRLQVVRKKIAWLIAYEQKDELRKLVRTLNPENPEEFLLIKRAEAAYRPVSELLRETEAYLHSRESPPPELWLLAARFALELRDAERAGRYLSRVKETDLLSPSDQANYWDLLGRYCLMRREIERARSCYRKLRDIVETLQRPEIQAAFYNNLAGFVLYLGDLPQARYYLERAQEIAGRHGLPTLYQVASMNHFLVYERALKFPEALQVLFRTFRRAWFRHAPPLTRLNALLNLILINFRLGYFEKAAHIYRKLHGPYYRRYPLVLLDGTETFVHALHTFEGHEGEIQQVLRDFHQLMEENPKDFPVSFRQMVAYLEGIAMVETGDPQGALQRYQEVLQRLDPRRSTYLVLTVQMFQAEATVLTGQLEEGRRLFRQVREKLQELFPAEVPYCRYLKVRSLVRMGEVPIHEIQNLERELNKLKAFGLARRVRELYPQR